MDKLLSILRTFRLIIFTLLVILAIPVGILVTTPILLFRSVGQIFVKYLYWDSKLILKIVNVTSQLLVSDHLNPNPRMNIVCCWIGEGKLDIETFRKLYETNVLNKIENNDKLMYPELQCYPTNIFGYYYWKKHQNFDIKDHVKVLEWDKPKNNIYTEEDFKKIIPHLTSKGWQRGMSPWECLLVNNYVDEVNQKTPKTVILFRIHHFMADGHCIVKLFECLNQGDFKATALCDSNLKRKLSEQLTKKSPIWGKLLTGLMLPYQFAIALDEILRKEDNEWKVPSMRQHKISQKMHQEWTCRIPLASMKLIKSKFGVSFAAVLNSVVAGAMQNLMKLGEQKVPQKVKAAMQVPLPGHPGGLSNHFGYLLVSWPVHEANPSKRLKLIAEDLKESEKSTFPLVCYMMYYFAGWFPPILSKGVMSLDSGYTVGFSIVAALDGEMFWANCKHLYSFHTVGTATGYTGVCFSANSGMESIRIAILIDQEVSPSEEVLQNFDKIIQKEVAALLTSIRAE